MVRIVHTRALLALIAASQFFGGGRDGFTNFIIGVSAVTECKDGQYLDTTCKSCAPGKFLNASALNKTKAWPSDCEACPGGTYVVTSGSDQCYECLPGEKSGVDRTQCESCQAGQFVAEDGLECLACPFGTYAPQALNDECLDCEAGSYTSKKVRPACPSKSTP